MTTQLVALTLMLASSPSLADDLTGSRTLLCTTVQTTVCFDEGECIDRTALELEHPAVHHRRSRAGRAPHHQGEWREPDNADQEHGARATGRSFLQGVEAQRAFSFVIHESSGEASFAVAMDELAVAAFGACTPLGQE